MARSPKEAGRASQPPPYQGGGGGRGEGNGREKEGDPEVAVDATLALAYVLLDPEPGGRTRLNPGQPEAHQ